MVLLCTIEPDKRTDCRTDQPGDRPGMQGNILEKHVEGSKWVCYHSSSFYFRNCTHFPTSLVSPEVIYTAICFNEAYDYTVSLCFSQPRLFVLIRPYY